MGRARCELLTLWCAAAMTKAREALAGMKLPSTARGQAAKFAPSEKYGAALARDVAKQFQAGAARKSRAAQTKGDDGRVSAPTPTVLHFVPPNLPGVGSPNGETQRGQYVAGNGGPQSRAEQALAGMSVTSKRPESREASVDRMKSKMEALPSAGSLTGSSVLADQFSKATGKLAEAIRSQLSNAHTMEL